MITGPLRTIDDDVHDLIMVDRVGHRSLGLCKYRCILDFAGTYVKAHDNTTADE